MEVNLNAEYQPQSSLLQRNEKARTLSKKRKLQEDITELEADIRDKKSEINEIMGRLKSMEEPCPEPILPTACPSNAEA